MLLVLTTSAAAPVTPARYVRFSEARPILTELASRLPPELAKLTPTQLESAWAGWIERHDREVRARLEQGDEDTLVNWVLFGTSFTSRPRAVLGAVESGAAGDRDVVLRRTIELISGRLDDLLTALQVPGTDERRLFARALLERRGLRFATVADREAAREYLLAAVIRVASEQDQIDPALHDVCRSTKQHGLPGCEDFPLRRDAGPSWGRHLQPDERRCSNGLQPDVRPGWPVADAHSPPAGAVCPHQPGD